MGNNKTRNMELNPQQQTFLKLYIDPKSPTWGNALQSGLKAGYDDDYARNILNQMPEWLKSNLDKTRLIQKAEKNLEMSLDGLLDDPEKGGKVLQQRSTEFVLSRLAKETYSERKEIGGIDGKSLVITIAKEVADRYETS